MQQLDEFTVEYFQNNDEAKKVYEEIQKIERELNKPLKMGNNEYFGRAHTTIYAVNDEEKFPSLLVLLVLHGEDVLDHLMDLGADFSKTERLESLDFVKNFSKEPASLVNLDTIDGDLAIVENGVNSIICFVNFNKAKSLNQEQLAQWIVREYVQKHFQVEGEYIVKVLSNSLFDL
ncbi:MAG: hypothetical protein WHT65_07085 [Pseudothermotoga sp.]